MNGLGDFKGLLETAQRIQAEVARVKDELGSRTVDGESGGGLVRCTASGTGEIVAVAIDPALAQIGAGDGATAAENKKMLEDLVVGAVNRALELARELARQEMAKVTGGLPLPPGMLGG